MTDSPVVSVIIPAYNTARWIGEQLGSLRAQLDAPPFEVLVCDNNSTDGTAATARAAADGLDLRIIDASGPPSAAHARNCGAQEARGSLLLFCDSDDLVDSHWVSELTHVASITSGALVAGRLHHQRFNDPDVRYAYHLPSEPSVSEVLASAHSVEEAGPFAGYLPSAPGGNLAIERQLYLDLGGMDPRFPGGSEETDFSWRAQRAGVRMVSASKAIVHYRLRSDPRGIFRQQRIQQRARIYLWTRHGEYGMIGPSWKYSLGHFLRDLIALITSRGDKARKLRAAYDLGGSVGALEGMLKYRVVATLSASRRRKHSAR